MNNTEQTGWLLIVFGLTLAAIETYRTSRLAAPVIVEANEKYLGSKTKIWLPIAMVALGVAIVAIERIGLIS